MSGVTTCLCNDLVSRDTLNTHSKNTVNIYASSISFLNLTHHEVVPSKGTVWFLCRVPVSIDCLGQWISFGGTFRGLPSNYLGAIFKESMTVLGSGTWGTAQRKADWTLPLHPYCTLVWPQSKLVRGRLWWQPFPQSWRAGEIKLALMVSAATQFSFPSSNFLKISVAESGYGLVKNARDGYHVKNCLRLCKKSSPEKMQLSMMPATVNVPPTIAHTWKSFV